MRAKHSAGLCAAGLFAFGVTAFAQTAGQQPTSSQPASTASSADEQVTLTGCIVREADYRASKEAGRGGVAGTGYGTGNEFILTNASPKADTATSASGAASTEATGTSGSSMSGSASAYELSGPNEGQLSQYVGKRVEITGKLKPAETTAGGSATGGATAGKPPSGVDVMSKDLKLRELEVGSVRESTGTCPPSK